MEDVRQGLPSASSFSRYAHCYGSYLAEKGIPEPERGPDADHGDAIHRALKGEKVELADEQRETFEMCQRLEAQVVGTSYEMNVRERRFWFLRELTKEMSGQVDSLWYGDVDKEGFPSRAFIVDFKTLFGEHEEAKDNYQLMVLAAIVDCHWSYMIDEITVALIQPWAKGQITVAKYDRPALDAARKEVLRILGEINKPDAPRTPGKWCQHCRYAPQCPEAQGQMWALKIATSNVLSHPEKLGEFYKMWKVIEPRGKELERVIKSILTKDPNAIPGLKLEAGEERRTVSDVMRAWQMLRDAGKVSQAQFTSFLTFTFGAAEEAIKENLKLKSKNAAKDKLNEILGDVIVKKQNAPSIAIDKSADVKETGKVLEMTKPK